MECTKCKKNKPLKEFSKNQKQCKICKNSFYKDNKEYIKSKSKQYYIDNKDPISESRKLYYQQNKESRNLYQRGYGIVNKGKILEYKRKYYFKNKKKIKSYVNEWTKNKYKNDEKFRINTKLNLQIIKYLHQHQNITKLPLILGYNVEEFIERIGTPKKGFDIDHKVPLSWFKETTPIHIIWDLRNLQIITKKENRSKGNKFNHPIEESYKKIILEHLKEDKKITN
jgi:hypothetical protein